VHATFYHFTTYPAAPTKKSPPSSQILSQVSSECCGRHANLPREGRRKSVRACIAHREGNLRHRQPLVVKQPLRQRHAMMDHMRFRRSAHEMLEAAGDVVIPNPTALLHVIDPQPEIEEMIEDVFVHDAHVGRSVRIGRRERVEIRRALGLDDLMWRAMVFASSHDVVLPQDATGYQMRRDTRCDGIPDATGYQMRRDTRVADEDVLSKKRSLVYPICDLLPSLQLKNNFSLSLDPIIPVLMDYPQYHDLRNDRLNRNAVPHVNIESCIIPISSHANFVKFADPIDMIYCSIRVYIYTYRYYFCSYFIDV